MNFTDEKKPYWTNPETIIPWTRRYRLRIDDRHTIQASGCVFSKRWHATLYRETLFGLLPVSRTAYHADPGNIETVQEEALSAMCRHAKTSKQARESVHAVGHALTAMSNAMRKEVARQ